MKERIKLHCKFAGTVAVTALLGLAMMMQSGCASAPKCVVENGRIVVDSPFDLEIGSTEYAKMFGSLVKTEAFANYDPKTKTTTIKPKVCLNVEPKPTLCSVCLR